MQAPSSALVERFAFLASALNASGGFAPCVLYAYDAAGLSKPSAVQGPCELVPYPRESALKFAARAAVACYENHLRASCERFVGQIARRAPVRDGLANPLVAAIVDDADWRGNTLDIFWHAFMVEAKARGTMLLLVDMPAEAAATQAEAAERRLVPYLTAIEPERVCAFELDERGRFRWVKIASNEVIDGKPQTVERYWDAAVWRVMQDKTILAEGEHPFGECPVLAFTEGSTYPHVGNFAQIADLSRRLYNARSELDEILRSQTFSLLTYQVTPESRATFNAQQVSATIGTHNMLVHEGEAPAFIAPPDGPANVYLQVIEQLQEAIRRVGFAIDEPRTAAAESGTALTIRFQALNGALSAFSQRMGDLEARVWGLVARALGLAAAPTADWPTDYALTDPVRELDVLTAMQATGFPDAALVAQRQRIAGEIFDTLAEDDLAALLLEIENNSHERAPAANA